jgi:hypothetical protein
MKRLYEVFVRVGSEGGVVVPKDGQPLETLGEAIALGKEYVPNCHEVLIIERHVATRLRGLLPPPEPNEKDAEKLEGVCPKCLGRDCGYDLRTGGVCGTKETKGGEAGSDA